jgi:hypothetical protein
MLSNFSKRTMSKCLRISSKRNMSRFKWQIMMDDSVSTVGHIETISSPSSPIGDLLYNIPLGPVQLFNEVYDLTTDTVVHLAETLGYGWAFGIIMGSFIVRYFIKNKMHNNPSII